MAGNDWFMSGFAIVEIAQPEHNLLHARGDSSMKITQLRNATAIVDLGGHRILIDPMLAAKDKLPPLKVLGQRQRNPIVELPPLTDTLLETVTHCLITHCQKGHFDHLDRAGKHWLRSRQVPVICTPHDAPHLRQRGLHVQPLGEDHRLPQPFLGGHITTVRCTHGRGIVGRLMEHGVGYFIELPGEPSLYIAGDTILTPEVLEFVRRHQPAVSLVPAGGAKFDIGHEVIMGVEDVIAFARASNGITVANHLEALSHCPVRRADLRDAAVRAGVMERMRIPADGQTVEFVA
jgi:L-ascorbate metabolism protein UlaG (beta-lactamase superfamily)